MTEPVKIAIERTHLESIRSIMNEMIEDLTLEIEKRYPPETRDHPAVQRAFDRDLHPVVRASAILKALDLDGEES